MNLQNMRRFNHFLLLLPLPALQKMSSSLTCIEIASNLPSSAHIPLQSILNKAARMILFNQITSHLCSKSVLPTSLRGNSQVLTMAFEALMIPSLDLSDLISCNLPLSQATPASSLLFLEAHVLFLRVEWNFIF